MLFWFVFAFLLFSWSSVLVRLWLAVYILPALFDHPSLLPTKTLARLSLPCGTLKSSLPLQILLNDVLAKINNMSYILYLSTCHSHHCFLWAASIMLHLTLSFTCSFKWVLEHILTLSLFPSAQINLFVTHVWSRKNVSLWAVSALGVSLS